MKAALFVAAMLLATSAFATSDIFLGEKHEPGFIHLNTDDELFYWMFYSRNDVDKDPLVLWLTGGPGCSSELAIFYENGPFKINNDTSLRLNPNSWNNKANLLYVDQPLGTGFSSGKVADYATNEDIVAEDMYKFLTLFLEKHTEFKGRPFFITGESYAGHYIPAISAYIVKQKNAELNFKGAAIGNGWTDPYLQYPEYNTFAYENKLIGSVQHYLLDASFKVCQDLIKVTPTLAYVECMLGMESITGNPPRFNVYDIRKPCDGALCYDFSLLSKFLERQDVITALGVQGKSWSDCNMEVHELLTGDWTTNMANNVEYVMDNGVRVLVYSGDKDFICNWRGGEAWTEALPTGEKYNFSGMDYTNWDVNSAAAGAHRHGGNLTFLRVFNAGHMVPMDQGVAAEAMLEDFIAGNL